MKVIPPILVTSANLVSSTVSDPSAPSSYSSGTTYAIGDQVSYNQIAYQSLVASNTANQPDISPLAWSIIGYKEVTWAVGTTYALGDYVAYNHRVYQSLQATNVGNNPYTSPLWWLDVGPTNRYAMFDLLRNTATFGVSPLTAVFNPGVRIDSVAVLGIAADTIEVKMVSAAITVYDKTIQVLNRTVVDWYSYFFAPFNQNAAILLSDLPPYSGATMTITGTRSSGNVAIGSVVVGAAVDLGQTQYSAEDDALNFSTIDRDTYGNSILIPRRSVPKTTQTTRAAVSLVEGIRAARTILNAVPAVWSGLDDSTQPYFQSLLILGIYKQFTINVAEQDYAVLTLELEEV